MSPDADERQTRITQGEREELLEAMLVDAPELTFTSRGDPDPRLIQLARLLGRQMAREAFAAQTNIISKRGSNGS